MYRIYVPYVYIAIFLFSFYNVSFGKCIIIHLFISRLMIYYTGCISIIAYEVYIYSLEYLQISYNFDVIMYLCMFIGMHVRTYVCTCVPMHMYTYMYLL